MEIATKYIAKANTFTYLSILINLWDLSSQEQIASGSYKFGHMDITSAVYVWNW
jgi:hypothetical protein